MVTNIPAPCGHYDGAHSPDQIIICGMMGGAGRFLVIPFDLSKPPLTFIQQAVAGLPAK